jgi:hypothetical protein
MRRWGSGSDVFPRCLRLRFSGVGRSKSVRLWCQQRRLTLSRSNLKPTYYHLSHQPSSNQKKRRSSATQSPRSPRPASTSRPGRKSTTASRINPRPLKSSGRSSTPTATPSTKSATATNLVTDACFPRYPINAGPFYIDWSTLESIPLGRLASSGMSQVYK